jgi:YVTN family beta-propeller protein
VRRYLLTGAFVLAVLPAVSWAQEEVGIQVEYDVVKTTKVAGNGGWEHMYADSAARRLYIPRTGTAAGITVLDLDSMKPVGTIAKVSARGIAIDSKTNHGFTAGAPVTMFDTQTLKPIKTIDVQGKPESIAFDASSDRVYVFNKTPTVTVISSTDGSLVGTIDVGGNAARGLADGQGKLYVAVEDKDEVAVVDTKTNTVTAHWDLDGTGAGPVALALDAKSRVLFVACRNETMLYMNADTGKFIYGLPIGAGVDSVVFNPATNEIFSAEDSGSLTIAAVTNPTSFAMKGTVQVPEGSKSVVLDSKTGNVLVASAKFAKEPKAASFYDIPDRGAIVAGSFQIETLAKGKAASK